MLLEVLRTSVLEELSSHPRITPLRKDASRLTIGDLLGSRFEIPQTVSAILMRQPLLGQRWEGIQALSTHGLHTSYAIFEYNLWNSNVSPLIMPITSDDATLCIVAIQLGLTV